jgi:hypothetical protein
VSNVSSLPPSPVDALRRQLDVLEQQLRPIAKARVSPREKLRSTARATFADAVQTLRDDGWSQNAIVDALGVDIRTYIDWLEGKRQLPAWVIAALPQSARVVFLRDALGWPEGKTGT